MFEFNQEAGVITVLSDVPEGTYSCKLSLFDNSESPASANYTIDISIQNLSGFVPKASTEESEAFKQPTMTIVDISSKGTV